MTVGRANNEKTPDQLAALLTAVQCENLCGVIVTAEAKTNCDQIDVFFTDDADYNTLNNALPTAALAGNQYFLHRHFNHYRKKNLTQPFTPKLLTSLFMHGILGRRVQIVATLTTHLDAALQRLDRTAQQELADAIEDVRHEDTALGETFRFLFACAAPDFFSVVPEKLDSENKEPLKADHVNPVVPPTISAPANKKHYLKSKEPRAFTFSARALKKSSQKTQTELNLPHWTTYPQSQTTLLTKLNLLVRFFKPAKQTTQHAKPVTILTPGAHTQTILFAPLMTART